MSVPLYDTDVQKITDRTAKTTLADTDVLVVADSSGTLAPITKVNTKETLGINANATAITTLNADVSTAGSVLKVVKDNAKDATFTPTGTIAATDIKGAIAEVSLDVDKLNDTVDTEGSVLKSIKDNAENATYDNTDSGLSATTLKTAIDENAGNVGNLAGAGRSTETVKKNADDIATLETTVDTNRLYSDSQYLALKAQADAQALEIQASRAELYNGYPILQFGSTDIIGKGTNADYSAVDVSANVVDGKLSMEQKGLTITNLVNNGDFSQGTTGFSSTNAGTPSVSDGVLSFTATATNGVIFTSQGIIRKSGNKYFISIWVKSTSNGVALYSKGGVIAGYNNHSGSGSWELLRAIFTAPSDNANWNIGVVDTGVSGWTEVQVKLVATYNLTALGLASITDTDILADLLPYVDGTQNVGKMGMRVVGRNLFDKSKATRGYRLSSLGVPEINSNLAISNYIEVEAAKEYVRNILYGNTGDRIAYYDKDKNLISFEILIASSFVIPNNAVYVRLNLFLIDIDIFQLEEGTVATTYEPYQEQLTFLPAIGNSLPNGTADSIKTVADGWEHSKRVSTPASVGSGVAVNTTNYPTAKNGGQWVNELTAGGTEIGVIGTDSTTGAGMLRFELKTPIVTKYDLPHLTSGKTIHRFAGEEKIALYGTGLTFSENVLSVLSAVKFVAGVMTDITSLATITWTTVTFSGVSATDVVYIKVEHDVDRPLGILEHTPAVSNTASRLKAIEDWIALQS